jgi:mgtE-like transporter
VLASAVVLVVTLALAGASARYGWDLDNVNAPLVSAVGDVVTVPALFVATLLADRGTFTAGLDVLVAAAAAAGIVAGWRSSRPVLRIIVRESVPVLAVTSAILAVAGVVIEGRFEDFAEQPALLILVPAALSGAGAVGSILSARLSTKLHLGLIQPAPVPGRAARADIATTLAVALPLFALSGLLAQGAATLGDRQGPGLATMVGVSLMGGMLATVVVVVIAYYGTVAATRMRVDPDSYGIPVVTSVVDLVGAYTLVLAIAVLASP